MHQTYFPVLLPTVQFSSNRFRSPKRCKLSQMTAVKDLELPLPLSIFIHTPTSVSNTSNKAKFISALNRKHVIKSWDECHHVVMVNLKSYQKGHVWRLYEWTIQLFVGLRFDSEWKIIQQRTITSSSPPWPLSGRWGSHWKYLPSQRSKRWPITWNSQDFPFSVTLPLLDLETDNHTVCSTI